MATSIIPVDKFQADSGTIPGNGSITYNLKDYGIYMLLTYHPTNTNLIGAYILGASTSAGGASVAIKSASPISFTISNNRVCTVSNSVGNGCRYVFMFFS